MHIYQSGHDAGAAEVLLYEVRRLFALVDYIDYFLTVHKNAQVLAKLHVFCAVKQFSVDKGVFHLRVLPVFVFRAAGKSGPFSTVHCNILMYFVQVLLTGVSVQIQSRTDIFVL